VESLLPASLCGCVETDVKPMMMMMMMMMLVVVVSEHVRK